MDLQWIGTAAVGALGIVATYTSGVSSRRHESHRDAVTRRANAYIEVLTIAEHVGNWAQRVRPLVDTTPPRDPPPLPDLNQQVRAQALMAAFGSDQVRDLLDRWRETVNEVSRADILIGFESQRRGEPREMRGEPIKIGNQDPWLALEQTLRPAEAAARGALGKRINQELTSQGRRWRPFPARPHRGEAGHYIATRDVP
jgi:hypothetical protein